MYAVIENQLFVPSKL